MAIYWNRFGNVVILRDDPDLDAEAESLGWRPPVDIYETPDAYVMAVELPGCSLDQIRVDLRGERVTVSGERTIQIGLPGQCHRLERQHGFFSRTFGFPQAIDESGIRAELSDGVLVITLPKVPDSGPRTVRIE